MMRIMMSLPISGETPKVANIARPARIWPPMMPIVPTKATVANRARTRFVP